MTTDAPVDSPRVAPTRPMYWSIRREIWENRSIYAAPVVTAGIVLFAFLISTISLPHRMHAALALAPGKQRDVITMPYNAAAGLILMTSFLAGVFYCLDALHGERRDRSILFWKSLPISDRTTVLAKAGIPLVVLPLFAFMLTLVTQLLILILNTIVLLRSPEHLAALYRNGAFVQSSIALLYGVVVIVLWHAPVYCWLLLVSGWAKRATFIWAVMPFLAVGVFEGIAFRTIYFVKFLGYRLGGWFTLAFVAHEKGSLPLEPLASLTPGRVLAAPGLWIGLVIAGIFLAAAVRLRRYREPI
jgi:ABC-2 type transport system permease protein